MRKDLQVLDDDTIQGLDNNDFQETSDGIDNTKGTTDTTLTNSNFLIANTRTTGARLKIKIKKPESGCV